MARQFVLPDVYGRAARSSVAAETSFPTTVNAFSSGPDWIVCLQVELHSRMPQYPADGFCDLVSGIAAHRGTDDGCPSSELFLWLPLAFGQRRPGGRGKSFEAQEDSLSGLGESSSFFGSCHGVLDTSDLSPEATGCVVEDDTILGTLINFGRLRVYGMGARPVDRSAFC